MRIIKTTHRIITDGGVLEIEKDNGQIILKRDYNESTEQSAISISMDELRDIVSLIKPFDAAGQNPNPFELQIKWTLPGSVMCADKQ